MLTTCILVDQRHCLSLVNKWWFISFQTVSLTVWMTNTLNDIPSSTHVSNFSCHDVSFKSLSLPWGTSKADLRWAWTTSRISVRRSTVERLCHPAHSSWTPSGEQHVGACLAGSNSVCYDCCRAAAFLEISCQWLPLPVSWLMVTHQKRDALTIVLSNCFNKSVN